ncbi:hypothetical protein D046_1284B, partial [Vibrio parahaemolyticus V-223/04]
SFLRQVPMLDRPPLGSNRSHLQSGSAPSNRRYCCQAYAMPIQKEQNSLRHLRQSHPPR